MVLKKKTAQQQQARRDRSLRTALMYRIIQVRIYTAAISEAIHEVVAWPGVGEGICSVLVEYTYVSLYNLFFCNAANDWNRIRSGRYIIH